MNKLIIFDGECVLCSNTVHWLLKRDKKGKFSFTERNSKKAFELAQDNSIEFPDSIVYLSDGKIHTQSDAVIKIMTDLEGIYKLAQLMFLFPKPLRNFIYKIISKNRYRWFGKQKHCFLPSEQERHRFI